MKIVIAGLAMLGGALMASKEDNEFRSAMKASTSFTKHLDVVEKFLNKDMWDKAEEEGLITVHDDMTVTYQDGFVDLFKRMGGCSSQIETHALMAESYMVEFSNYAFNEDGTPSLDVAAKFIRETVGDTDRDDLIDEAGGTWDVILNEISDEIEDGQQVLQRYIDLREEACPTKLSGLRKSRQ